MKKTKDKYLGISILTSELCPPDKLFLCTKAEADNIKKFEKEWSKIKKRFITANNSALDLTREVENE